MKVFFINLHDDYSRISTLAVGMNISGYLWHFPVWDGNVLTCFLIGYSSIEIHLVSAWFPLKSHPSQPEILTTFPAFLPRQRRILAFVYASQQLVDCFRHIVRLIPFPLFLAPSPTPRRIFWDQHLDAMLDEPYHLPQKRVNLLQFHQNWSHPIVGILSCHS